MASLRFSENGPFELSEKVNQMMLLFARMATALKPLICLPGIYGSNLYATYREYSERWYCPAQMDHEMFWLDSRFAIPPWHQCLFELIKCKYDPRTGKVSSADGVHIEVADFGGSGGISYADKGFGDLHLIESFDGMIEYFVSKGYRLKKDLFGVPYDWRLTIIGLDSLWPKFTKLVEKAYKKNNNQKVTLLGFSNGALVIQHFLTVIHNTEWNEKYIEKVIYLAPAYSGSGVTLEASWTKVFPLVPSLSGPVVSAAIDSLPVVQALLPNYEVFAEHPCVTGPNGEKIYPKDWKLLLKEHNRIGNMSYLMLEQAEKYLEKGPVDNKLPTYIIYNTAMTTSYGLRFKESWDEIPTSDSINGDGTVPGIAAVWPCDHWRRDGGASLICRDVNARKAGFQHDGLAHNLEIQELIWDLTNVDDWWKLNQQKKISEPRRG